MATATAPEAPTQEKTWKHRVNFTTREGDLFTKHSFFVKDLSDVFSIEANDKFTTAEALENLPKLKNQG